MSELDTRALRALKDEATPGPMHASRTSIRDSRGYLVAATYTSDPYNFDSPAQPGLENAAYIVALVNAAPALLDEVDALRARVAELEREVERVREALESLRAPLGSCAEYTSYGIGGAHTIGELCKAVRAALAPRAEVKP